MEREEEVENNRPNVHWKCHLAAARGENPSRQILTVDMHSSRQIMDSTVSGWTKTQMHDHQSQVTTDSECRCE